MKLIITWLRFGIIAGGRLCVVKTRRRNVLVVSFHLKRCDRRWRRRILNHRLLTVETASRRRQISTVIITFRRTIHRQLLRIQRETLYPVQ